MEFVKKLLTTFNLGSTETSESRRWESRGCLMPPGKEEPMLTNGERECQDVDKDLTVRHARGNRMNPW